jgi:hypothetical protein
MGCLNGSTTLQALGGVNSPCGWYRVRGQLPSTGGQEHTHTHTHILTITIVSQKYQDLSVKVEIGE